ncbi:SPX-domain-containing protein [Metschnikowia bicuspidata]|uniref:SPX-domain-containing protein n=1 Tax=Metschnikowia bicuspidata TaxID=27322 RepID=A0A4P9ZKA7_9ASCO|nr:SPX-domain-containing protein [Metschnikowia bicuspidata]
MKFGKYLASRQLELPEYSGHFIDYKALKKLIKKLGMPALSNQAHIQQRLKENKASFFFKVERELDKVNSFYLEKQANLAVNLDLLRMKKNELLANSVYAASDSLDYSLVKFKNSILYLNLYHSFKKLHQDLLRLQQFIELNEAGFLKVVKKWDKRSKSHTKELFIQTAVSVQPVFHSNEINELSDMVTLSLFDLELIMDGDYSALKNVPVADLKMDDLKPENPFPMSDPGSRDSIKPPRRISYTGGQTNEIDELYSSFVNIATSKVLDMAMLQSWIDKVRLSKRSAESIRRTLSEIFLLSVSNLKISDSFLEAFLKQVDYDIDFELTTYNNKPIIHECCSIPPASIPENKHSTMINNGVKVLNSDDSIKHLRLFLVKYILLLFSQKAWEDLLLRPEFNGRTCLHYAAQNNRLDILELILPTFSKNHVDDLDKYSMSALLLAINHGNFNVITLLFKSGSKFCPEFNDSKLQYLPINHALEYLLNSGKPTPEMGLLPLHVLARSDNSKLIGLLVQYGADVNRLDGLKKWPPMFYAALEGHAKTTHELIKYGARLDFVDEHGYNVLYYSVIEGHIEALNHLLSYKTKFPSSENASNPDADASPSNYDRVAATLLDEDEDLEDSGKTEKNVDSIPHLQLPPPILPLRRYGHSFLEQKVLIELLFSIEESCINIFNSGTELRPGRITITSNISDLVPRNILLPSSDGEKGLLNCMFQTERDSLNEFRIDFEIFPKFGTRLIAKTTALNFYQIDIFSPEVKSILLPLFDIRLRNIGEFKFNYQVIFPFSGTLLETTKYDTYWKSSTNFVKNTTAVIFNAAGGSSPNNILSPTSINLNKPKLSLGHVNGAITSPKDSNGLLTSSFVTATSLSGEYFRIKVCLLNDGTPVVCPHWAIAVAENIELYLPNLSLEQLTSLTSNLFDYQKVMRDLAQMTSKNLNLVKKLLKIIYLPLDVLLDLLDVSINLSIELKFPSVLEMEHLPFAGNIQSNLNTFIDLTLNSVFNHIRAMKKQKVSLGRSIIFISSNSNVCKILNWKQPNFPVFLIMNGIMYNNKLGEFEARTANGLLMDELLAKKTDNGLTDITLHAQNNKRQLLANDQELTIRSIKEATNFSIDNNLIGIIASIHLLNLVPKLIPLIRSRGLILIASNDYFDSRDGDEFSYKELDTYTRSEINGLRFDDILSFKGSSEVI